MVMYHIIRSDGLSIVSLGTTYSLEAAKETIRKNICHYNNNLIQKDDSNFFKMYSMNGMEYVQIDDEEDESCCWGIIPIKVDERRSRLNVIGVSSRHRIAKAALFRKGVVFINNYSILISIFCIFIGIINIAAHYAFEDDSIQELLIGILCMATGFFGLGTWFPRI